jgi:hypothetical protein
MKLFLSVIKFKRYRHLHLQLSVIARIEELGTLLTVLVPNTPPLLCTYRDSTLMTMGSKSATATPARVASATKENFMVKKWLADLIPQRFIASVYSWDNWIQEDRERERENQEVQTSERRNGGIKVQDGGVFLASYPLIVRSIVPDTSPISIWPLKPQNGRV